MTSATELLFTKLLGIGHDVTDQSVSVAMASDTGRVFQLNMTASLATAMIGAVASEVGAVVEQLPPEAQVTHPLIASAIKLADSAEGLPVLTFRLAGGGLLSIQLSAGDREALVDALRGGEFDTRPLVN